MVTFKNSEADPNGGGMYVTDFSNIVFKGSTTVTFNNNIARSYGGAVYIRYGTIEFVENSKISFDNNSAKSGSAVYFFDTCISTTQSMRLAGNSIV